MECQSNLQSDCEDCFLCSASNKAHAMTNSARAFLSNVRQKAKTGTSCVLQIISERLRCFEVAHPNISEFLRSGGRKILLAGVVVRESTKKVYHKGVSSVRNAYALTRSAVVAASPSAQRARGFFIENNLKCFFCGSVMHVTGSLLYAFEAFTAGSSGLFTCSVLLIFVRGGVMWVPMVCWLLSRRQSNQTDEESSQAQLLDKPPLYESLPPVFPPQPLGHFTEPPPTYEETFANNSGLLNDSDCGSIAPPCAVHLPLVDTVVVLSSDSDRGQSPSTCVVPALQISEQPISLEAV